MQAMQALRDHWQAVVVDRLMRLAAAAGEPLAQRALPPEQLAALREAQPGAASERIACADAAPPAAAPAAGPPLDMAIIPMALLQRGAAAALTGAPEVPGCDPAAGAVRPAPAPWLLSVCMQAMYVVHYSFCGGSASRSLAESVQ